MKIVCCSELLSPIQTLSKSHGFQSSVLEKKADDNNVYIHANGRNTTVDDSWHLSKSGDL